ncbi:hypothetical protein KP509_19G077500 [Ceratopteris richardii]|uniref:Uncharacterized protein n=1 Tax=Ceratopteris richardii TaxID=49495 RepID=A0A8T2SNU9_CERRI|nr:hypothetical protein KP509_19G077500 [Ceratopteris richardii]
MLEGLQASNVATLVNNETEQKLQIVVAAQCAISSGSWAVKFVEDSMRRGDTHGSSSVGSKLTADE